MKYFIRFQTKENVLNNTNLAILKTIKYADKYTPLNYRHLYEARFFDTQEEAENFLVSKDFLESFYYKWLQKRNEVSIDIKCISDSYYADIFKNEHNIELNRDREVSGKLWEEEKPSIKDSERLEKIARFIYSHNLGNKSNYSILI